MKASDLTKAAKDYALAQLGEEQYKTQKWAVRAICDDYKAGYRAGYRAGKAATQAPRAPKAAPTP